MARKTSKQRAEDSAKERAFDESQATRKANEAAIVQALAEDHPDFAYNMASGYPLYGSVGSVTVGSSFQGYGRDDDRCTWSEVGAMLAEFPPVPLILHRAGCVGVRPQSADDNNPNAEITELWPVTVRVDNGQAYGRHAQVEWYSELRPGVLVHMIAILRTEDHPATMMVETRRDGRTGVLVESKRKGIQPAPWFLQGFADSMRINYGGGSCTDPGSCLIYWPNGATQPGAVSDVWGGMKTA